MQLPLLQVPGRAEQGLEHLKRAGPLLVAGAALVALAMLDVRACPSWFALGIPCPGCGLVRATLALATGHPAEAWRLHPLVFVVVPVGLAEPFRRWRYPRAAAWTALVLLVGTWALRLATGTHPDGLHPEQGALARAWGYVAGP